MKSLFEYLNESLNESYVKGKFPQKLLATRNPDNKAEIEGKYIIPVFWTLTSGERAGWDKELVKLAKKYHAKFIPDSGDETPLYYTIDYLRSASAPIFGTKNDWMHNGDYENQIIIIDAKGDRWDTALKLIGEHEEGKEAWWVQYRLLDDTDMIIKASKYPVILTDHNEPLENALKKFKVKYEIF